MPRRLCYLLLPAILCAASVAPTVGRADDVVDSADLSEADLELDVSLELEELTERDSGWFEDPSRYGPHQDFERGNWWGWLPKRHTYSRAIERTPDMMGDFFSGESIAVQTNAIVENFVLGDLPVAGGSRNTKVAEHNRAIPTDRVYFIYHHFHLALRYLRSVNATSPFFKSDEFSIDRYTAGFEKTFLRDAWSIELRMPLTNEFE